ncbi:MAG TPA: hypothetical protein VJC07_03570 [Candidatus Nanoarchaeia archaeon]|nr:hypothetical protein [Candidatus Nanoarchaeia archaeon]
MVAIGITAGKKELDRLEKLLVEKGFPGQPPTRARDIAYQIAWNINHSARPDDHGPDPKSYCPAVFTFGRREEMRALNLIDENDLLTKEAKDMYRRLHAWYSSEDLFL